jgi:endonuclease/exonuclease/phosphatase family metal-dependent hydrolase
MFHTEFDDIENAIYFKAKNLTPPQNTTNQLKIMNWNIKFGGGRIDFFFDCYGDRVLMTEKEVINNMNGLINKIKKENPDILFIQEADINSKRAAYVNEVQYILDNTDLNYAVYASQWKADYVPSDGIGKVDTGNAILSKYPLKDAKRIALPLMDSQDSLTKYFYLKRNILKTHIVVNDKKLNLLAIHTSAYSQDGTKLKQIKILKEKMDEINSAGEIFIAGGDLNTIPPKSEKLKDFPDSICTDEDFQADDYTDDLGILDDYYKDYTPAISLSDYEADNSKYFSHTTDKNGFWNRKLDYLFTNGKFSNGMIHQSIEQGGDNTMKLSDHAPLTVNFNFE